MGLVAKNFCGVNTPLTPLLVLPVTAIASHQSLEGHWFNSHQVFRNVPVF